MFTFFNLSFFINFFYFWFTLFIAFYIPGSVILSRFKFNLFQSIILGTIVGMVFWAWQGYLFGYLNLRIFSYLYLAIFAFFWFKINKQILLELGKDGIIKKIRSFKINKIVLSLILIGSFLQLTSVFFVGVMTTKGMFFCCGNTPDNILNISITNQVIERIPPFEPGYYGKEISNYHYWSSLVIGELIRVFKLPLIETNFQYITVFISLFLGLVALVFGQLLKLGKAFTYWLIFFLYFGADLIWGFVALLRGNSFFMMRPLESGQQFLENIPRAMAVLVILAGFCLFSIFLRRKNLALGIITALVFSSSVGFKVYLGFFIFPGLVFLTIYWLFKKNYINLIFIILIFVLSMLIYFPVNAQAGGLYFTGLWRFENFIVQPYLGELSRLELARIIFQTHENWLRVIQYELTFVAIFILAIFGTKVIGVIQTRRSLSKLPFEFNVILITGIVSSFIVGSFFNQTSGGANTFNFLASIFILSSIYAALSLSHFFNKKNLIFFIILIFIVFLTVPRGLYHSYQNLSDIFSFKGFLISKEELEGLRFLKDLKMTGLVLADPNILEDKNSPYISFIANQRMFLSGQDNELIAHNVNFEERLASLNIIIYSPHESSVSAKLKENNIRYLFLLNSTNLFSTGSAKFLNEDFKNKKVKILEFNSRQNEE